VVAVEGNPRDPNHRRSRANLERLDDLRLAGGARPEVVRLPFPSPLRFGRLRLPASYANFYFCNAALLVPTFNDPADRRALGVLAEVVRDRPVVGIHAANLVLGRGAIHCLTREQPQPR
jgi:agmatine deiminase